MDVWNPFIKPKQDEQREPEPLAGKGPSADAPVAKAPHVYRKRRVVEFREKAFRIGEGRISAYLAVFLGACSLLAVLCYRYPALLTTADLRAVYDGDQLRLVLLLGMWFSFIFSMFTFILERRRMYGAVGVLLTLMAFALGGAEVATGNTDQSQLSIGVDWLVLALIISAIVFIFLEKIFPKYPEQVILRPEWKLDLFYFCFNHLLISVFLLLGNFFVTTVFGWAVSENLQAALGSLPIWVQVVILIVFADFVLYWSHRCFHEIPWLWRIHAVHHSVEHMDWLAGSRNHFVQALVDRSLAMVPLYLLGADKAALDIYVGFAAFQSVFVHANISLPFGPLKYLVATPQYHHWHHSTDRPAIDTNYAVHTPLFDRLFGTYHMPVKHWPANYGTTKRLPRTFIGQLIYPFRRR